MTRLSVIISFLICFSPIFVNAQTELPPDFSGWEFIGYSRIELRISDCDTVYIGIEENYQDPGDNMQYARVVKTHIPLVISSCDSYDKKSAIATATNLYVRQEERNILRERSEQSDPILYVSWNAQGDHGVKIWILPPEGPDRYGRWQVFENITVADEFLTENVGASNPRNIFSGKKYQVGDIYHLIRVARRNIIKLIYGEEEK